MCSLRSVSHRDAPDCRSLPHQQPRGSAPSASRRSPAAGRRSPGRSSTPRRLPSPGHRSRCIASNRPMLAGDASRSSARVRRPTGPECTSSRIWVTGYFMLSVEGAGFARTFHSASIAGPCVAAGRHRAQTARIDRDSRRGSGRQAGRRSPRPGDRPERGVNGECRLRQLWMRSLGISIPPSDAEGCLRLPPLPSGEIIKATIDHPRLAPVRTDDLTAAPGATAKVKMRPGVAVTLHVPVDPPAERITSARRRPAARAFRRPVDDPRLRGGIRSQRVPLDSPSRRGTTRGSCCSTRTSS